MAACDVWGGLRSALALALALSLDNTFPLPRSATGSNLWVVVFSILHRPDDEAPAQGSSLANGRA